MSVFWSEAWQIIRGFASRPAFVAVTVLTLGLGIGANVAIFSAVDALLLRSLPFAEPDRLVFLWSDGTERGFAQQDIVNSGVLKEWGRSLQSLESLGGINTWDSTLTRDEGAMLVKGAMVSHNFFAMLGVPLTMGRGFSPEEDVENGPRVVIVSHDFWQRELGGGANALGQQVELNRESWTVVGVLPDGFHAPTQTQAQLFRPLQDNLDPERGFYLPVIARLKPGVSVAQADADLDVVQARLAEEFHQLRQLSGYVQPLQEALVQNVSKQLVVLLGATFLVLLIACANIANLLLARAVGRSRELAIRSAVGASRFDILRQVLIESTLLSLLGMVVGIGLAWFAIEWISMALPVGLAERVTLAIDLRVMGFAILIALATGLISGSVPALLACRRDAGAALRDAQRGSSGGRDGQRTRALLVAGTFALALALTVSAGLFLKSLLRILDVDPGFRAEGVLTFSINFSESQYPDGDALRVAQDGLLERLQSVPGVENVGFTSTLPLGGLITDTGTAIEGVPLEDNPLRTWYSRVSPGYLATLGAPLLKGRDFVAGDRPEQPCVVLATETYVERYLGERDPIGTRVILAPASSAIPCEIVGVYRDMRFNGLSTPLDPTLYLPTGHFPNRQFFVVMRTPGEPMSMLPAVRQAVSGFDRGLAVWAPTPMTNLVDDSLRTSRQVASLAGAFAVLALLLAASGVYGVATYNVNARMREFGVRTALGARRGDLFRLVLTGGLWLVGSGMAVGVLLTIASGRLLSSLLYEVEPFDLQVFGTVSALLIVAAMLAMLVPARRAARVQPMEALRYE